MAESTTSRSTPALPVSSIALDDVAAMESYQTPVQTGKTVAASAGISVGATAVVIAGVVLYKALFGSCPTIYSVADGAPVLEAESFSYSIAPSFEARDVDRLNVPAGDRHTVGLIVRNEGLETHYINHLELLEVVHEGGQRVLPDPQGQPLVVGKLNVPLSAVDRGGRQITGVLDLPDGTSWGSDATRLHRASLDDFEDYVDLEFETPGDSDRVALVFRLRNTLLNTVLLYDVMLKDQGFRALDWLAISPEVHRAAVRAVPLAQVEVPEMGPLGDGLENLASPDQSYVETRPGEALHVRFDVDAAPEDLTRTFLLAAQGYYIEWMRHDWLKETSPKPFKPSDESLIRAIRLWEAKRDTFQKLFETRILSK